MLVDRLVDCACPEGMAGPRWLRRRPTGGVSWLRTLEAGKRNRRRAGRLCLKHQRFPFSYLDHVTLFSRGGWRDFAIELPPIFCNLIQSRQQHASCCLCWPVYYLERAITYIVGRCRRCGYRCRRIPLRMARPKTRVRGAAQHGTFTFETATPAPRPEPLNPRQLPLLIIADITPSISTRPGFQTLAVQSIAESFKASSHEYAGRRAS